MGNGCNPLGSEWTMAHLEDMRLPVVAREALVDDPSFLRDLVEAVLNRFLDAEITVNAGLVFDVFAGSRLTLSPARSWRPPGSGVGVGRCACGASGGRSRLGC